MCRDPHLWVDSEGRYVRRRYSLELLYVILLHSACTNVRMCHYSSPPLGTPHVTSHHITLCMSHTTRGLVKPSPSSLPSPSLLSSPLLFSRLLPSSPLFTFLFSPPPLLSSLLLPSLSPSPPSFAQSCLALLILWSCLRHAFH